MPDTSRQIAAIMFTDIKGYTKLMGQDEEKALEILNLNREIQSLLVKKYNGEWLKEMGDGTLISFPSALEAVRCARDIQNETRHGPLGNKIRIGIHLGDITRDNKDIFGDGVNIASRLQSIADPGGVYFSKAIYELIQSRKDVQIKDLGPLSLKNVKKPIHTYAIQNPGFPKPQIKKGLRRKGILFLLVAFMVSLAIILFFNSLIGGNRGIRSVAVLPFENLTSASDQEYFASGMTQTLVANLGKVSSLKVIMNRSTAIFAEKGRSFKEIGKQLGVDAIIGGSVVREGETVRITAQMTDADTEELLWIDSYDRPITNILQLHSTLAQTIVDEIQVLVTADEIQELQEASEVEPAAYEALLKAQYYLYKLTPENYDLAMNFFEQAIESDPLSAQAYAGMAMLWVHRGQWGAEAPLIAAERGRRFANKALEIDPDLAEAHLALAQIHTGYEWDWVSAEKEFDKAISLNPNLSEPYGFFADLLVSTHKNEKAISMIETALKLDPENGFIFSLSGWTYFALKDFDRAEVDLKKSIELEVQMPLSHRCLWSIYHQRGNEDLAIHHAAEFYKAQALEETAEDIIQAYPEQGYVETLRYAARRLEERMSRKYVSGMRIARFYALTGDHQKAIDWLEKAYEDRYSSIFSLNVDSHWQSLHNEPRFLQLLEKANLTL